MKLIGFTFPPISVYRAYLEMGYIKKKKVASKQKNLKKKKRINLAGYFVEFMMKGFSKLLVSLEPKFL